jgi:diacylglycerol kinase family enzyme
MYFYIYDAFAAKPQYTKKTNQISLKLADLGIIDEQGKASPLRPIESLVKEALSDKKCRNIIAVGDDQTASQIINSIASSERKITFGIIPLRPSKIARALGIEEGETACQEISARKIERVNLGRINGRYFLTSAEIKFQTHKKKFNSFFKKFFGQDPSTIKLNFENKFTVSAKVEDFSIINIPSFSDFKKIGRNDIQKKINPKDNLLDIVILGRQERFLSRGKRLKLSFFQTKRVKLESKDQIEISADNRLIKKLPCDIAIASNNLEVIVGRKRSF